MVSVLITAPTAAVTTRAAVKSALGISDTSQDSMIDAALAAIIGQLDPAQGGWLGRALRPQVWELRMPYFDDCEIRLPYPVVTAVASVKYDDQSGTETTLTENTHYRVFGLGAHVNTYIRPVFNGTWPTARGDFESVRIRYTSGYALTPADLMPAAIFQAIAVGVRGLLSNSTNMFVVHDKVEGIGEKRYSVTEAANEIVRTTVESLLGTYRVYS